MPMCDPGAGGRAIRELPGLPRDDHGPVFGAPWQAHAFAMAVTLQQAGVFTWGEWASTLGDEIKRAQAAGDPDNGDTYYRHWLAALERLITEKNVASRQSLARTAEAWHRAAGRTPHGHPIELRPQDFSD
jgi:nitrile hydratase accessory protein